MLRKNYARKILMAYSALVSVTSIQIIVSGFFFHLLRRRERCREEKWKLLQGQSRMLNCEMRFLLASFLGADV